MTLKANSNLKLEAEESGFSSLFSTTRINSEIYWSSANNNHLSVSGNIDLADEHKEQNQDEQLYDLNIKIDGAGKKKYQEVTSDQRQANKIQPTIAGEQSQSQTFHSQKNKQEHNPDSIPSSTEL